MFQPNGPSHFLLGLLWDHPLHLHKPSRMTLGTKLSICEDQGLLYSSAAPLLGVLVLFVQDFVMDIPGQHCHGPRRAPARACHYNETAQYT